MDGLRGKRVGVFGLGKSGLSAVSLLLREGARVVALDERAELADAPAVKAWVASGQVGLALGAAHIYEVLGVSGSEGRGGEVPCLLEQAKQSAEQSPEGLDPREQSPDGLDLWERSPDRDGSAGLDLLVVSPGVPLATPVIVAAKKAGLEVIGEVELAFRLMPTRPLVAITGTNGKSTTTALTGEIFNQASRRTFVGGNLGLPLAEAALAPAPFDAYVVELSSFQLEGVSQFRANGAAILNLTPDHIDRYPDHAAYGAAKARIFLNQQAGDFAVINADDAEVVELARAAKVPVFGFTMGDAVGRGRETAPTGKGSGSGVSLAGLAIAEDGGFRFDFAPLRFQVKSRALRGAHNLQNAMAAALLAHHAGIPAAAIARALETFPGLPHRIESVRMLDGVEWVNDSKATNVDSSLVALKAFSKNVWLIAGGKGKGAPYAPLVEAGRSVLKGVLTLGKDAPAIREAFEKVTPVHSCETIDVAVRRARELAVAGDVVLLSPACASYDQFKNFEDRGDTFKRLVRGLAE